MSGENKWEYLTYSVLIICAMIVIVALLIISLEMRKITGC